MASEIVMSSGGKTPAGVEVDVWCGGKPGARHPELVELGMSYW
jgi:hypothetical protein